MPYCFSKPCVSGSRLSPLGPATATLPSRLAAATRESQPLATAEPGGEAAGAEPQAASSKTRATHATRCTPLLYSSGYRLSTDTGYNQPPAWLRTTNTLTGLPA